MPKRYHAIGYGLAFLALVGFLLGWKLFIARPSPESAAEYNRRIQITAANISAPAETADDSLKIFAVNVVHKAPFKEPFIGNGIYLGNGLVLTAAHVVGRWPFYTNLRVLIGGQDLPAKVLKEGSPAQTDLALLSVDQRRLPASLQLRRNPLCKGPLQVGMNVIVVYPERTVRSQMISPLLIAPQHRSKYSTLISDPEGSGSGVFNAEQKCFVGIMSAKIAKYAYQGEHMTARPNGFAGYFVPISNGKNFVPPQ
jgi:Trypsin-like peptidase domain